MLNHPHLFRSQSTSIKHTRIGKDQLVDDTTAMPLTSPNFFGKSPSDSSRTLHLSFLGSTGILRPSLAGMTGLHRTESLTGLDRFPKTDLSMTLNGIQSKDPPEKLSLSTMKSTASTSFLFDIKPSTSEPMVIPNRSFHFHHNDSLDIRLRR